MSGKCGGFRRSWFTGKTVVPAVLLVACVSSPALAQEAQEAPQSEESGIDLEVYGFVKFDAMSDLSGRMDPKWTSAFRPSRIATPEGQFGSNGETTFSVKQSRLGLRASGDEIGMPWEAKIEFDLFGVGDDAGKTTLRMRHAYGRWGPVLIGQTSSVFGDSENGPNVIDPWGPPGVSTLRTQQIRLTLVDKNGIQAMAALEHVGENIDAGGIRLIDENLASSIKGKSTLPDLTAAVRYSGESGHVRLGGLLREIAYETPGQTDSKPKGKELGWGVNLSGLFRFNNFVSVRGGAIYGKGIASYIADGGMDLAPAITPVGVPLVFPAPPIQQFLILEAKSVPLLALSAFAELKWNKKLTSSFGYSQTSVDNTNFQTGNTFHKGQYASGNLLWSPVPRILTGGELLWGRRSNVDGTTGDNVRVQFSFKLSFSSKDLKL